MRVLVTNDDLRLPRADDARGDGRGRGARTAWWSPPRRESSGASASLLGAEQDRRLIVASKPSPGLPDEIPSFAVRAARADRGYVAAYGGFGPKPDVVLSEASTAVRTRGTRCCTRARSAPRCRARRTGSRGSRCRSRTTSPGTGRRRRSRGRSVDRSSSTARATPRAQPQRAGPARRAGAGAAGAARVVRCGAGADPRARARPPASSRSDVEITRRPDADAGCSRAARRRSAPGCWPRRSATRLAGVRPMTA